MGTVQTAGMTFDDFMKIPDPSSGHLELHHGEVVSVPPRTQSHAKLQQVLFRILLPLAEGKGFLNVEFPFRVAGHEAWQVDLGFVREERSDIPDPYLVGAPDWVIEVLSPSNTVTEMNEKIDICMNNGCSSFWVIDPKQRIITVTERGDVIRQYRESMPAPLPEPLEGSIPVASIFSL